MYAVIETGGKQYRVSPGDVIEIERLTGADDSPEVEFDRILLVANDDGVKVGTPEVEGARVTAKVVDAIRGPKVRVFKMKRRKGYRRHNGHRQELLRVQIEGIEA